MRSEVVPVSSTIGTVPGVVGSTERSSGRFWLPGHPEQTVGGWLDTSGRWPMVELAEPLTPSLREVSRAEQPDGSHLVKLQPADDDVQPDKVTVHGVLRDGPRGVTLVGASTSGRQQVWGGVVKDPGMERLRADYALIGGRTEGREARFRYARVQLQHLDVWAQLPGISGEVAHDGSWAVMTHERPDKETIELHEPPGWLVLDSVLTMPQLTVRGASLTRTAELRWESSEAGITVDELWLRFVDPLCVLLSLASDADSPAVSLQVRDGDGDRWLQVVHYGQDTTVGESLASHKLLLTREHLGLYQLGRWLSRAGPLSPVPQLVAGVVVSSSDRTLQNQLLELATAAEGLHRRLYPNQRGMTKKQARQAQRVAGNAVLKELRDQVIGALGHLAEPTYRERLRVLVERACEVAPGVTGDSEEWVGRVVASRNGFAHQLTGDKSREAELEEDLVLLRSLRWLLTTLLLLEAGTAPETLAGRLQQHQPYLHFRRQAERWLPAVYAPGS